MLYKDTLSGGMTYLLPLRQPTKYNKSLVNTIKVSDLDVMTQITATLLCLIFNDEMNSQYERYNFFLSQILKRSKIIDKNILQLCNFYLIKIFCTKNNFSTKLSEGCERTIINCPKRLVLSCILLSSKYLMDETCTMKVWNKITGLPVVELNKIERDCLNALGYKLHVNSALHAKWNSLFDGIIKNEKLQRNSIGKSFVYGGKTNDHSNINSINNNNSYYSNVNSQLLSPPSSPELPKLTKLLNSTERIISSTSQFDTSNNNSIKENLLKAIQPSNTNKFCATIAFDFKRQLAQLLGEFVKNNSNEFPNPAATANFKFVHATNIKKRTRDADEKEDLSTVDIKSVKKTRV